MANSLLDQVAALLRDPDVRRYLEITEVGAASMVERLAVPSGSGAANARAIAVALRPKILLLERVEMNSSARREYDATGPVWSFELSAPMRGCLTLLDALEALAAGPGEAGVAA